MLMTLGVASTRILLASLIFRCAQNTTFTNQVNQKNTRKGQLHNDPVGHGLPRRLRHRHRNLNLHFNIHRIFHKNSVPHFRMFWIYVELKIRRV
ncbi:hypothetical protein L596_024320 [Steinernema carpocapsae]|uniref:Secreted protein n=1 Tax=Steinernema carpocapsae TaxID=34508 RepID=A0A4U5MGF6_STECR|nr:hypothetical protein L596_024320 [Steinernema carpocapsae]